MELQHTRKRFRQRIEFERNILSEVNKLSTTPLHGLSKSAILIWEKENSLITVINELSEKLISLSKSLMIYSDSSRHTFDIDKRISATEMIQQINAFTIYIRTLKV